MAKVKVKSGQIFERKEKKYLLTRDKFDCLVERLQPYMSFDDYGLHTIHTIYYDTSDFDVIRHSVSKPKFKEKLRLRSYGQPTNDSQVFIELKKKVAGITYKRREKLIYGQAQAFLKGRQIDKKSQILNEIDYYQKQEPLQPKVLISYDRLAMFGKNDPDFRITFDQNIRYSLTEFDLTQADSITQELLTDANTILMEIKISECFPLEISRLLSELDIYQGKFTKYGNIYKEIIAPIYYQEKEKNYAFKYSI
ncbi:molecular chaperone [Lactococcus hodotermopsidis]|uniref:Molecular chaperone n=1 Tax=Pseudolactococcus hodotermopsidis TaxID=2709157 RepID=A0A6A0BD07_9LACT|nr:polyphosphate polymerase domain-containing protein [Lactococcus hodotermopsidis]GFH42238.1 molecular chaperone [Lactococcus hodotermopsidis]